MRRFVLDVVRVEVLDEVRDGLFGWLEHVDGLELRQRFAILHDVLDNRHALADYVVHLAARRDDAHAQIVHHQHLPVALFLHRVRSQHVVHDLCKKKQRNS